MTIFLQPPYSPDFVLGNLYIFEIGISADSIDDIKANSLKALENVLKEFEDE